MLLQIISSRLFVLGLVLTGTAFLSIPLFTTTEGIIRTYPTADNPSWDAMMPMRVDYTIPALLFVSGLVLMLLAVVRTRNSTRRFEHATDRK